MADPVSLAITVALNVATMAMTMMNKVEGPRLDDLTVTTADYGTPLVQIYGTRRVEAPCFYAEGIREEKHKSKGKTGKYAEYKYFGTWANIIADCMNPAGALTDVLKIYLDRRLMYDKTKAGPISIGGFFEALTGEGLKIGQNCRIYLGTETQQPDHRLLAKIEAKEGAGRCPAYLGLAYVVFEEIPLEKFGNRLPQCSVVGMRAAPIVLYPYEAHDTAIGFGNVNVWGNSTLFTPNFHKFVSILGQQIEVWDVANRTLAYSGALSVGASNPIGVTNSGSFYTISDFPSSKLWLVSPYGGATLITDRVQLFAQGCEYAAGNVYVHAYAYINTGYGILTSDDLGLVVQAVGTTYINTQFTEDEDGQLLIFGCDQNPFATGLSINDQPVASPTGGNSCGFDTGLGTYCVAQGGNLYLIDKDSLAITHTATGVYNAAFAAIYSIMKNCKPGMGFIYVETKKYSTEDLTLLKTESPSNWTSDPVSDFRYDPLNHALIGATTFSAKLAWLFLDRSSPNGYPLADICTDVALQCGYREGEFDFSDLDQVVLGYSFTQGPGKDVIGPLLEIHDSDIRPHGFIQEGLKRGQPLTGETISSEWMVPEGRGDEAGTEPLYSIPITAETDLPRRVWATFADPALDEQPNTAIVQRNSSSVRTDREVSFDLGTLAIETDDMQPMLERALRRYWVGATKPKCRLTPLELRLEPGDVRHLLFDGERLRCRATRTRIRANRIIDTEWELDGETQLNPPDWELDDASPLTRLFNSPGGTTNGRDPDEILVPQDTKGFVIDTPLFSDAQDQSAPFIYLAAGPEFGGGFWPGTGVYSSDTDDDVESYVAGWDSIPSDFEATWGFTTGTVPSAAADVIDYGSEIELVLPAGGSLESSTEALVLADQSVNLAVLGDELVQFIDADEISTNRWVLTGLVRGARGTEYAIDTHDGSERFVLVSSAVRKHIMGAGEIGDTDYYKFSTLGDNLDSTETTALEFQANAHRPLSPAHVQLQREPGGDWAISWVRRTRIGGGTINGQDVPLGEVSELYRVKIMDGADVVETYETTDPDLTYTAAQQTADWGSAQTSLSVQVVQVSPALSLEGFATEASA